MVPPAEMRVIADVRVVGSDWVPDAPSVPLGATYSVLPAGGGVMSPVVTSRQSVFGRPPEPAGVKRVVLLPAYRVTVSVLVTPVSKAPVPSNEGPSTVVRLRITEAGRPLVVPLANRTASVAVPADA